MLLGKPPSEIWCNFQNPFARRCARLQFKGEKIKQNIYRVTGYAEVLEQDQNSPLDSGRHFIHLHNPRLQVMKTSFCRRAARTCPNPSASSGLHTWIKSRPSILPAEPWRLLMECQLSISTASSQFTELIKQNKSWRQVTLKRKKQSNILSETIKDFKIPEQC